MSKKQKKQFPIVVSPAGTAGFSYLDRPDSEGKYADDKYKTQIRYDDPNVDLSRVEKACRAAAKLEWGKVPEDLKMPFGPSTRDEDEGIIILKASSKFAPTVIDAKRNPLPEGVKVFGGDLIKLSAQTYPYEKTDQVIEVVNGKKKRVTVKTYGVSLQLRGVQLLEKRGGAGGSDATNDFEDEDEYEAIEDTSTDDDFADDDAGGDDVDDF